MNALKTTNTMGCAGCIRRNGLGFDLSMAFQPIVNVTKQEIFAHEALVRGRNGEPAAHIFQNVNESNLYQFDQTCRVRAVQLASQLNMQPYLSINFMPNAVYRPEQCIRTTLAVAEECGFPINRIIFEITEGEEVKDPAHLRSIVEYYKQLGFLIALDDFGAGYAGLNRLADVQADIVKLDMAMIRGIDKDKSRRIIARGIVQVCHELSMQVIAEGVETYEELSTMRDFGVELFQGYYFARPAFESLAEVMPERYPIPL